MGTAATCVCLVFWALKMATHSPQSTSNTLETIPESFAENLRIYSQPMPDKSFQGTQFFANICNLTSPTQN